ncbi:MAG: hypothetical protein RL033_5854 [Pseudomonadota bacterium]
MARRWSNRSSDDPICSRRCPCWMSADASQHHVEQRTLEGTRQLEWLSRPSLARQTVARRGVAHDCLHSTSAPAHGVESGAQLGSVTEPWDHRRAASRRGNIYARDGVMTELRMLTSAVRSSRGCAASPSYSPWHVQRMLSALRIRRPSKIAPSMSCDRPRACDDRDRRDHGLNLRHPPPWVGV